MASTDGRAVCSRAGEWQSTPQPKRCYRLFARLTASGQGNGPAARALRRFKIRRQRDRQQAQVRACLCQRIGHTAGVGDAVVRLQRMGQSKHTSASGWSSCAAPSPGRRWQTRECSSMVQARWSSSSRHLWRVGTTHLVMSPLELMQRLAARATEGRLSCARATAQAAPYRFHGVLAPNAKLRSLVVPQGPPKGTQAYPFLVAGPRAG